MYIHTNTQQTISYFQLTTKHRERGDHHVIVITIIRTTTIARTNSDYVHRLVLLYYIEYTHLLVHYLFVPQTQTSFWNVVVLFLHSL